jgi:hypothetical protein
MPRNAECRSFCTLPATQIESAKTLSNTLAEANRGFF